MKSKTKTYADKLLANKEFKEAFEKEYKSLVASEQRASKRSEDLKVAKK